MKSINNCFVAIQGWMVENLGLKGNELMTYALIYGFSQDGKSEFTGSVSYICQWLSCSRTTAHQALKNLLDKKLIKKTEIYKNSVKYCTYRTLPVQNLNTQSKNLTPPVQKLNKPSTETEHNNIYNIDNNIEEPPTPEFDKIWQLYNKGNREQSQKIYNQLPDTTKHLIHHHLHGDHCHIGYLQSTQTDACRYRQNLQNYLTQQTYLQPLEEHDTPNIELL